MTVKGIDLDARWFAGKGRAVAGVSDAGGAGGLRLVDVSYEDGGAERYLGIPDAFRWAPLLAAMPVAGDGGRLELRGEVSCDGAERVPAVDQSNTLVAMGERVLVKAYRRLEPGSHPEVEVLSALSGAPVPAFLGSLHWVPDYGGSDTVVALLQEFVPGAEAGWEAPIERAAEALRAESGVATAESHVAAGSRAAGRPSAESHVAAEWRAAGRATAELHAALRDAFGTTRATRADLARWRAEAEAALAAARVPADIAAEVRARLAGFDAVTPPALTRIHGDLHIAQFLRHPGPPLIIDFEGDPLRPLAERRRPDTPLRDLAGLLRSADHVGSAASRRAGGALPDTWIAAATAAVLDGYGEAVDPDLLAVLELAKECAELVYAQRVLPEWEYAPRLGLARLLER
jgi:maltokinase